MICTFQAIRFLHECGVLLHYPDVKSKLSKLFFLEPEWLCSLMAQIITVPEVNPLIDKQGVSLLLPLFPSLRNEYSASLTSTYFGLFYAAAPSEPHPSSAQGA